MTGIPLYQYRFFLQVNDIFLACSKVISQDNSILIERNHVFGQKTLDEIIPADSPLGSGIWLFTKKDSHHTEPVNARLILLSWKRKQWHPLKLWHGSFESAMETMVLLDVNYLGVKDYPADSLPKILEKTLK